jgi:hypothetical protein
MQHTETSQAPLKPPNQALVSLLPFQHILYALPFRLLELQAHNYEPAKQYLNIMYLALKGFIRHKYQKTIPIGQAGGNNYSQWMYTLTPAYAGTIKEGINRITAKLVCQAGPINLKIL